jgi:SAM-dependent methyltransferase
MIMSDSVVRNGWDSYPAEVWCRPRPVLDVKDIPFWVYCAREFTGPILDLCCGNGRYSIPLARLGYEVVGVDINQGMIEQARNLLTTAEDHELKVSFQVADIVDLNLGKTFRLAVMPGWSWQVLLTQEDQVGFLSRLHDHLSPGAGFAFNVFIPFIRQQGLLESQGSYYWPPDSSYHAGSPRTYDPQTQIETLVESNIHPIRLRHTTLAEFELLFRLTGFEISEMFGDDATMRPFAVTKHNDYTIITRRV